MEIDKDFADVFAKTQMISGMIRSRLLIFSPKKSLPPSSSKSYSQKTIDINKEEEHKKEELISSIPDLRREITELKEQLRAKDHEMGQYEADADILKNLFDKDIIDSDGNYIGFS